MTRSPLTLVVAAGLFAVVLSGCGEESSGETVTPVADSDTAIAPTDTAPIDTMPVETVPIDTVPMDTTTEAVSGTTGSLIGTWESSDGLTKIFAADGSCQGFYYLADSGEPLDIGGPSSCALSSSQDSTGRYKLKVIQGPNQSSYQVEFQGEDAATVFTTSGTELYRLTRF